MSAQEWHEPVEEPFDDPAAFDDDGADDELQWQPVGRYICAPCAEGRHHGCAEPGVCRCTIHPDTGEDEATYEPGDGHSCDENAVEEIDGPTPTGAVTVVERCSLCHRAVRSYVDSVL